MLRGKIIEFDAWKYERTDILSALLRKIEKKFNDQKTKSEFVKTTGLFIADKVLQHYSGISLSDAEEKFKKFIDEIDTASESLEKTVGEK